jgi:hypothetical protein
LPLNSYEEQHIGLQICYCFSILTDIETHRQVSFKVHNINTVRYVYGYNQYSSLYIWIQAVQFVMYMDISITVREIYGYKQYSSLNFPQKQRLRWSGG